MTHFYSQDIPTSLQKTQLVAGGRDILVWSGMQGTLGILIPFVGREDVDFFLSLEQHMRSEDAPLAGRDHLAYRSYYAPVKGTIDGDCKFDLSRHGKRILGNCANKFPVCERFALLPNDKKQSIAGDMDRTVREMERKISVSFLILLFLNTANIGTTGHEDPGCLLRALQFQ